MKTGYFHTGGEDLYYEKMNIDGAPCRTLVLHGAGASDITRTQSLREALFSKGIPTLAFDFSGHGKSTSREPLSIRKRIQEAREIAYTFLDTDRDIQIIGFSMSGEVAIRLTEVFQVRNLVLFAPGIYHQDAIDIPFGDEFRDFIRIPESWRQNRIQEILETYRGFLFLLTPENDTVIPEGVNEIIMSSAPQAYKKRIIISGAPHMVGKWMNDHPEKIENFIDSLQLL